MNDERDWAPETRWCPTCGEYIVPDPAEQPLDVCPDCGEDNL